MKVLLDYIEEETAKLAQDGFFVFLRDESKPARDRLDFVKHVTPWVLGFIDLCKHILYQENATDPLQKLINTHTLEDDGHWKWFLRDVDKLGHNTTGTFVELVEFLWGGQTLHSRTLGLTLASFGRTDSAVQKLVLLETVEAVNAHALAAARIAAAALHREEGIELEYFGTTHGDVEDQHSIDGDEVAQSLRQIELSEAQRETLRPVIDQTVEAFRRMMGELLVACSAK